MVAAIDRALLAEGTGGLVPRTTVLLPGSEGELISQRRVVNLPTGHVQRRAIKPVWLLSSLLVLAILAVPFIWASLRPLDVLATVTAVAIPIPATEITVSSTPMPTSTLEPTFTPDPTATTTETATHTPTATASPSPSPTATITGEVLPDTFRAQDGALMRLVPAGEFLMGSTGMEVEAAVASCVQHPDDDACATSDFAGELPQRSVFLTAFYLDETEVTNAQYRACVNAGGCNDLPAGTGRYRRSEYYDRDTFARYPVVWVSWADAEDYCAWAGKRLPTEAEWEKAARGVDGRIFPWGNTFDPTLANTQERGLEELTPVGQYPQGASPYGMLDMAGNVWEYVADWYDPAYYGQSPDNDPPGPAASPSGDRILRSGSYANFQHYARAANRGFVPPNSRTQFRGIRCALDGAQGQP
jgi:formylglycine-generating enzyme required for sulfatase activity